MASASALVNVDMGGVRSAFVGGSVLCVVVRSQVEGLGARVEECVDKCSTLEKLKEFICITEGLDVVSCRVCRLMIGYSIYTSIKEVFYR